MESPQVSVIMTVYNTAEYISEAVESILTQTFDDFEFIIIDDCSTDDSWDILSSYSKQDDRIVLRRNQENLGTARSSNKGLALAKGKYIARFDSDDISLPNRLQVQLDYMENNLSVDLITTAVEYISDNGIYIGEYTPPTDPVMIRWCYIFSSPLRHPTAFWHRKKIESLVGQYDPKFRYALDYDFFARTCNNATVHTLSNILVKMRQRSSSITFSQGNNQDKFAAHVTYKQFDRYFSDSPIAESEKYNLRVLLRRHSPLQEKEFSKFNKKQFESATANYLRLFGVFCLLHCSDIKEKQEKLLHTEVERHLPSLMRYGLLNGFKRESFNLIVSYMKTYPRRTLATLRTLSLYLPYYSLQSVDFFIPLLTKVRSNYLGSR